MNAPPRVFDRARIVRNLERRRTGGDDFVTTLTLYDLEERLLAVTRSFTRALIMGPDAAVSVAIGRIACTNTSW